MESNDTLSWYAMSATFGRELKARSYLESHSVECYVPMKQGIVTNNQKKKERRLIPAINNLIFVHSVKSRIQELKRGVDYLQYLTNHVNGKNLPIVVPDKEMQHFIDVCETHDESLIYLSANEINLAKGTPVKILGGLFDGVEGTFIKVSHHRSKKVVVHIQGIAAVVITDISDGYLQLL